ncbi:hypothetical protein HPB48_015916 [Haemaphysalis longicornis]|uniref:Uncharacterized protein n=1 Tax=Haemaphysalis longicornis TaxID=44386 RepID=A0A9J6GXQ9_HAELO|nr:hypothetical protein HPB48_015916 [Haemaphysalis longicornis]
MMNLSNVRDDLQERYRTEGRTYVDLVRLRHQTANIKKYAKLFARKRWEEHCYSFSSHTWSRKLWSTLRSLAGRTKLQGTVDMALLRTGQSREFFEREAARIFLPPTPSQPPPYIYALEPVDDSEQIEMPFTSAELTVALEQINVSSTPGKDGVSWFMLRNLPVAQKKELLQALNDIWMDQWRRPFSPQGRCCGTHSQGRQGSFSRCKFTSNLAYVYPCN